MNKKWLCNLLIQEVSHKNSGVHDQEVEGRERVEINTILISGMGAFKKLNELIDVSHTHRKKNNPNCFYLYENLCE